MRKKSAGINGTVNVGTAINFMRREKQLSARALSAAAGLSPSYVSKVESGEMEPSFRAFCNIAAVLELSDAEIVFLVRLK